MPNEPDAGRERRLDEVGRAAGREISAGRPFDPAAWLERHPDLRPELDARLAELQRDASTLSLGGAGGASGGGTVAFESGAGTPTEAAPDATAAYAPNPPQATEADLGQTGDFEPARGRTEPAFGATVSHGGPGPTLPFGESPADPDASARPDPARGGGGGGVPVPGGGSGALRPGRRVKYIGDYEIVRILGQGGMGVVYEALQISLNRPVALKLIRNAEFASEEQLKRFQNEAEAVASLDDEGIVPVYEVGSFEDQRYFSMKLIEGGGLDKRLGHFSRNPKEAARVVAAVADAIHHAHQLGNMAPALNSSNNRHRIKPRQPESLH